jgi:SSS family solute:Na+ symporter
MKVSPLDLIILFVCMAMSVAVGFYFSRRQTGTSSFFLGGGRMPGWLVGFSITASMISAMTFLAIPGFSFKEDYRWVVPSFSFLIMAIFAMIVLVPFFRKITTPSGYAFLEQRFGIWARVYAAGGFLLFNALRLGVVLYVTSLSLEVFLGIPAPWLILALGVVATLYTMTGGFEAVVWTEFFQAIVLIAGALILVPTALIAIPGGLETVVQTAVPAGKMSLGSLEFTLTEKTLWVMILASLFYNASDYTTRQDFIQRYRAARTIGQARLALGIAAVTVVPIWLYFNFLGTTLWTYYQVNPDPVVAEFAAKDPEKIVPYFMASHLPSGLNGLVLAAVLMASMSTLAPILNACAATWIGDFHERFIAPGRDEKYYLKLSRWSTCAIGILMIVLAIWIHALRTQTLQDLQATGHMILSAGLFGLFLLGFFSARTGRRAALFATICTVGLVAAWVALSASPVQALWPRLQGRIPDTFWIPVISNILLPVLALLFAKILNEPLRETDNLVPKASPTDRSPSQGWLEKTGKR